MIMIMTKSDENDYRKEGGDVGDEPDNLSHTYILSLHLIQCPEITISTTTKFVRVRVWSFEILKWQSLTH